MQQFARLFTELDATTKTTGKLAALRRYFGTARPSDAAWALYFLSGRRPKQPIGPRKLAAWATELADIDDWLFQECYDVVGDLAETITLLLPVPQANTSPSFSELVESRLLTLRSLPEDTQREVVTDAWMTLPAETRFVWNKLLTGGFRVGVSQQLVARALAELAGLPVPVIVHRLMGDWSPTAEMFQNLLLPDEGAAVRSRPYPFYLASPLEGEITDLGDCLDWVAEWKWDGIRAQILHRGGEIFIWSRGEELVTERFPEITRAAKQLPEGTVLDGEILAVQHGRVLPFTELQRRINRKTVGKKLLADVPVRFLAFDLLESEGQDRRNWPLQARRHQLDQMVRPQDLTPQQVTTAPTLLSVEPRAISVSPSLETAHWNDLATLRETSRDRGVEGLMLKRKSSVYGTGRTRGDWWKWKISPLTVDCVMLYAQVGHGKRANLFTDFTFAVWQDDLLVPFAKAYSGLTNAELEEIDRFVRKNTREKFGPVRSVTPELVFELAFEAIQPSTRHKSGIAVRFPRIVRWRKDKTPDQADSLATIRAMLASQMPDSAESNETEGRNL